MGNARAVQTLPAFVNQWAGSAGRSLEVLRSDPRVEVRTPSPEEFPDAVAEEIRKGARRIVVAGGDGTLTTAAKGLTDTPASLCIVPSAR